MNQNQQDSVLWNSESNKNNHIKQNNYIDISQVFSAHKSFLKNDIILQSAITNNKILSQLHGAQIFLKRQDLQKGKTFKIRGAYYYFLKNQKLIRQKGGFVSVSDGNFAASLAIIARQFKFKCKIFIPHSCFQYKLQAIHNFGGQYVQVIQDGDVYQETQQIAIKFAQKQNLPFVSPHFSLDVFPGYATIAKQIIDQKRFSEVDYIIVPSGGGGLVCSIASFMKQVSPNTKIIAVQPQNCTPFSDSIAAGKIVNSQSISRFCNGSSIRTIGKNCFAIGKTCVDGFVSVSQRKLAETVIKLYSMGYICQPSGALAVAALHQIRQQIQGKKVVCLLTGSNMDLGRLQMARQMNAISKGYKNYYIVQFPNRKNAAFDLLSKCFKKNDIISINYVRHSNREANQAILGVQSPSQQNVEFSLNMMSELKYKVQNITDRKQLLELIF